MRKLSYIGLTAAVAVCVVSAADWPSQSGNPQRDGWARGEKAFTPENAGKIELLYKYKAENQSRGLSSLGAPVVNGFLITYLGFKEMLAFGGSSDNVWSVDADLNRVIWKVNIGSKDGKPAASPTSVCPGGMTASIAMPGTSANAGARGGGAPAGGRGRGPGAPGAAPAAGRGPAGPPPAPPAPTLLGAGNFGRGANFAAVASDGTLHVLNSSTGGERTKAPIKFLPANAKVSALNVNNNIVYAATLDDCGGNANAIYAINVEKEDDPKISTFETGSSAAGSAGTAIASDGTVFAQVPAGKDYNDTVLALSPDLKVKDYFTPAGTALPVTKGVPTTGATPMVITLKGRELVVAGGRDGRLHVLDAKAPGGADHHTSLVSSQPVATPDAKFAGNGFSGTFASWETEAGDVRWILASVWGPVNGKGTGAVIAFKLEDQGGKLSLTPAWTSRDMLAPAPVVTANGLVFALSTGQSARQAKENGTLYTVAEKQKMASKAVLYVLDATTGKELYSSGNMTSTFSTSGVAVANRRIYFTTNDNLVYSLGFLAEQPQLTGK